MLALNPRELRRGVSGLPCGPRRIAGSGPCADGGGGGQMPKGHAVLCEGEMIRSHGGYHAERRGAGASLRTGSWWRPQRRSSRSRSCARSPCTRGPSPNSRRWRSSVPTRRLRRHRGRRYRPQHQMDHSASAAFHPRRPNKLARTTKPGSNRSSATSRPNTLQFLSLYAASVGRGGGRVTSSSRWVTICDFG